MTVGAMNNWTILRHAAAVCTTLLPLQTFAQPSDIIISGDSQTSPFFDSGEPRGQGWAEYLEQQTGIQVYNHAKSGATTRLWLTHPFSHLDCWNSTECWGVILLGTNDSKFNFIPTSEPAQNLKIIAQNMRAVGATRVFALIPGDWFGFPWWTQRKQEITAAIFLECSMGTEYECGPDLRTLPPELHTWSPYFNIRTAHPTIAGHAFIGQWMVDFIQMEGQ